MNHMNSQYGECLLLQKHFEGRNPGYFVDIGAADGIRYSNTLNLIRDGWSGILVEPCHHFLDILNKDYKDHKNVSVFPGAVSSYNGTSKFHVWSKGEDSQISTIVEEQYESIKNSDWWKGKGSFTNEYQVDVINPSTLFKKFNAPKYIEFVDIDAEASEMEILNSWPWDDYEVEIFCIEFSMGKEVLDNFMVSKDYRSLAMTGGNLLYCKNEKWDICFKTIQHFIKVK
jgi:FkbM family methyltransferase